VTAYPYDGLRADPGISVISGSVRGTVRYKA